MPLYLVVVLAVAVLLAPFIFRKNRSSGVSLPLNVVATLAGIGVALLAAVLLHR